MGRGTRRWLGESWETIRLSLRDATDALRGRRDPLIPPRRLLYDGPRDPDLFRANGREFLQHYLERCGLRPGENVLDVGSGMGRKTVPLTAYLSPAARYLGLDVHRRGVEWCRARISSRFANFEFQHIDVFNQRYNPKGVQTDATFAFPCSDESFDFVVMASVFTHMLPDGVRRYLRETARVLRRESGRSLVSFFLLDEESESGIAAGQSAFRFAHRRGPYAAEDPELPEDAVAYDASFIRQLYAEAGLAIAAVYPGSWCGRASAVSFQDLVLARPAGSPR